MTTRIIIGDARTRLAELPAESLHCVVTSPPYWGLRDYGVAGQIGLEPEYREYVATLVAVFREVRRVLRADGTVWLNLGDSYCSTDKWGGGIGGNAGKHTLADDGSVPSWAVRERKPLQSGLKPKDLCGIPWRVAFALQEDGWYLRQDIIWAKPNPMPESVTDRCTKAHEYIFLLSKSARYYFDAAAIAESSIYPDDKRRPVGSKGAWQIDGREQRANGGGTAYDHDTATRNKRSVWTVATSPYSEAHFATFPPALIEPCILAGTSARGVCPSCGEPWLRSHRNFEGDHETAGRPKQTRGMQDATSTLSLSGQNSWAERGSKSQTIGWWLPCKCRRASSDLYPLPVPATILDPFFGAGTTGLVADRLARHCIGIELNPAYAAMAQRRIDDDAGMFAETWCEAAQ